jgi:hypothetical protein
MCSHGSARLRRVASAALVARVVLLGLVVLTAACGKDGAGPDSPEQLPAQLSPDAPVPVLMSESAAQRLWPGEDAVGRTIRVPWGESRVIGVVG